MVDDGYLIGYEDTNGDFVEVGRFNNQAEDTNQPVEIVHTGSGEKVELGPGGFNANNITANLVNTAGIIIDSTVRYASSDTELDDALASANGGDMIILGNATYTTDRTISKDLCFVGSHDQFGGVIESTWTLEAGIKIQNTGVSGEGGNFTVNSSNCTIESCSGDPTVTVSADNFRFLNNVGGGITFESGTTGGIVDGCSGTSVTDNGTNTVGDIA